MHHRRQISKCDIWQQQLQQRYKLAGVTAAEQHSHSVHDTESKLASKGKLI
jgi:hypothetical protein